MAFKLMPIVFGVLHVCGAGPALTLEDLNAVDDMMSVGSYVREVRAASPQNWHKSYDNEGDGEIGYSRKKNGGGKKGYQHFDSYHKKAGDNYEFEKQDSFGHDNGEDKDAHHDHHEGDEGAYSHKKEQRAKYRDARPKRNRQSDKYTVPEYEGYEDDVEPKEEKSSHGEPEEHQNEEIREGDPDGNGGVEAIGHDAADYKLPQKYTYGSGEEYNF